MENYYSSLVACALRKMLHSGRTDVSPPLLLAEMACCLQVIKTEVLYRHEHRKPEHQLEFCVVGTQQIHSSVNYRKVNSAPHHKLYIYQVVTLGVVY